MDSRKNRSWKWFHGRAAAHGLHCACQAFLTLPVCPLQECGLLRKGTVLLADNVIVPGTPDFLAYVRGSSSFECTHYSSYLEYMKVVDGLEKAVYQGPGSSPVKS
jgi:hypothetical protein